MRERQGTERVRGKMCKVSRSDSVYTMFFHGETLATAKSEFRNLPDVENREINIYTL